MQTALEMQSSRMSNGSFDEVPRITVPRTLVNLRYYSKLIKCIYSAYCLNTSIFFFFNICICRDNTRTITSSLPVSPSSSPLRHDGAAFNSFFLSPPHPSYPYIAQSNQNYNHHSVFPIRPVSRNSLDPLLEIPQYRGHSPFRSPTRNIL